MAPSIVLFSRVLSHYEFTNLAFQDKVLLIIRPQLYSAQGYSLTGRHPSHARFFRATEAPRESSRNIRHSSHVKMSFPGLPVAESCHPITSSDSSQNKFCLEKPSFIVGGWAGSASSHPQHSTSSHKLTTYTEGGNIAPHSYSGGATALGVLGSAWSICGRVLPQ